MRHLARIILTLSVLCGCVLCGCASTHGSRAVKVGIYMSGSNRTDEESKFVADGLTDALSESSYFTVTERAREFLDMIAKENTYQQSGAVDNSQIAKIGQKSGATYVCVAELIKISEFFPESNEVLLTARFISVDSATVVASTYRITVLQDKKNTLSISKLLVKDLVRAMKKRDQWMNMGEKRVKKENTAIYLVNGDDGIGKVLQTFLVDAVLKRDRYAVSERTGSFLKSLGEELEHQYSGAVADNQLATLGKQSGVKYVIALKRIDNEERWGGTSGNLQADSQWINIRMIDVTTGDIVKGKSKTAPIIFTSVKAIERSMSVLISAFLGANASHETLTEEKAAGKKATNRNATEAPGDNEAKIGAAEPEKQTAGGAQTTKAAKEPDTPKPGRNVSDIQRVINRNLPEIQAAYNAHKQRRGLSYGTAQKIFVKISIDGFGRVVSAKIEESTITDTDFKTTVLSYVKRWNFEKSDKQGDAADEIIFPVDFPADPSQPEKKFGGETQTPYYFDDDDYYDD